MAYSATGRSDDAEPFIDLITHTKEDIMSNSALAPEVENLKTRLKRTWMAGDYDRFSRYMESGAREFYERLNVAPGSQLLDVGCGSGQLALMAAKDGLEAGRAGHRRQFGRAGQSARTSGRATGPI